MRAVIVGAGGIGTELVRILARRKDNDLVVIEENEERAREISAEIDALVLHGDGTHPEILSKARLGESDALVAVTGSDAINAVIAMLGRRAGVSKVVVKLDEVGLRAALKEIGVTDIIAPRLAAAAHIVSALYGFHRLDFTLVSRGGLQLVEVPAGPTAGKTLSELHLADDTLVVAVVREQESLLARGRTRLERGDILLVLVESSAAHERLLERLDSAGDGD
ncbi:MAG TPA: NAD-binding protein [Vicinamibacteria bacterium]|nr:NAD-binding protein [Vicinamibacteria bacterium]